MVNKMNALEIFDKFNLKCWKVRDADVEEFIQSTRNELLKMETEELKLMSVLQYIKSIVKKVKGV